LNAEGTAFFMKTIVITSKKGGSGKTTLAAHLAVEAERVGATPVWGIDPDKQGSLSLWHERRESGTLQRADVPFVRLAEWLKVPDMKPNEKLNETFNEFIKKSS
jgi:chromosome partitioning protein